jgi:putative glycosyltransferase
MKLSIVTTLYSSAGYIEEFYKRISICAQKITRDFEIIFVNDGSPDNSLTTAVSLYENDDRVKIIDLSRNFGHYKAIFTGLNIARGEYVYLTDCDLEEPPELLEKFWEEIIHNPDYDTIYGVQKERKGNLFRKISGSIFFNLFNVLSEIKMVKNTTITRIMTRQYVDDLLKHQEREIAFAGLCILTGYNQKSLCIDKEYKGSTTYNLLNRVKTAVNFITSFSNKPLEQIFYLGIIITSFSFLFILLIVLGKIFYGITVDGWTTIIASLWLIGGIIIFNLGIIGIYLSKIFIETKNRPYTIIKNVYSRDIDDRYIKKDC